MKALGGWADGPVRVDLSRDELVAVNNALNEVLNGPNALGHHEFHAGVGVTRDEAEQLLDDVGLILRH